MGLPVTIFRSSDRLPRAECAIGLHEFGDFQEHDGIGTKQRTKMKSRLPDGWHSVTPRIVARGSAQLVNFLQEVFGSTGEYRSAGPSEIRIGDSLVMISEAGARKPMAAMLYVYVEDADAAYSRAMDARAHSIEEPIDTPYGDRGCVIEDSWGNIWQIATYRE